jgi:hypothetical protein
MDSRNFEISSNKIVKYKNSGDFGT